MTVIPRLACFAGQGGSGSFCMSLLLPCPAAVAKQGCAGLSEPAALALLQSRNAVSASRLVMLFGAAASSHPRRVGACGADVRFSFERVGLGVCRRPRGGRLLRDRLASVLLL